MKNMRINLLFAALILIFVPTVGLAQGNDIAADALPSAHIDGAARGVQDAEGDGYLAADDEGYLAGAGAQKPSDAQTQPAAPVRTGPASQTSDEEGTYVAAPTGDIDRINGGRLMVYAYAGFWIFALIYMLTLASRARRTNRELEDLYSHVRTLDDRIRELESEV